MARTFFFLLFLFLPLKTFVVIYKGQAVISGATFGRPKRKTTLALPNFLSPKSPVDTPRIIKTVKFDFDRTRSSNLRGHEIIESLDLGGKANSRLTSGSSSR